MANSGLSQNDKRRLLLLLAEAQARGLPTPDLPVSVVGVGAKRWPLDGKGWFIRNDGVIYNPTENQSAFILDRSRFSSFRGGRGSGKSSAGAQKALKKIMQGKSGAVMNPDFENFKFSTWPEFKNWIPWSMVVPSQRHRARPEWEPHQPFTLVFLNGARVYCKGLKNADSARGPNLEWLWYDESGRDPDGVAWQLAISGVRVGEYPQAWSTGTPKGKGHWTYKFFVLKELPEDALKELEKFFLNHPEYAGIPLISEYHGSAEDNKSNLDPLFYASVLATYPSGFLRQQEVYGEYADEGGQIGDRNWFKEHEILSISEITKLDLHIVKSVRYWDMAATEKKLKNDPDEAVGSLVHKLNNNDHVFADQIAGWFAWDKLKVVIADAARRDGPEVTVVIEEEPASGGKNQVAEMISYFQTFPELKNHRIIGQKPMDRVHEANMWFAPAAQGHIWIIKSSGTGKFYEQLDGFLLIEHDDRITSYSGAFRFLSPFKTWKKQEFIAL